MNAMVRLAELHWYEAHGIGKKEFNRKGYLEAIEVPAAVRASLRKASRA